MNLTDLRAVVRMQTQTTTGDLPDQTVDTYLQQAFERTINAETQWPFYEMRWSLVLAPGTSSMALPADVNEAGIMALYDSDNSFRLVMIGNEFANDHYSGPQVGSIAPFQFSLWGGEIQLWPMVNNSSVERNYILRGYRKPVTWLTPANEPDCDTRLHLALTHYAVALAYAQQEDDTLELSYMDRWQRDAELARRAIMEPRHQRPLVMSGSIDMVPAPGPSWVLEPPTP